MLLVWWMLVLSARCSGADEIPIDIERAELSSTKLSYSAEKAIDGDATTRAGSTNQDNPWLRLYFKNSNVEKVVIERGYFYSTACRYSVSVFAGDVKTLCGVYNKPQASLYSEVVQCSGNRGESVMLESKDCNTELSIYEIKVYYKPGRHSIL